MKWSWKAFGMQLVAMVVLGLALGYLVSIPIEARRGPGGADATMLSLAVGAFLATILLAALAGWKGWGVMPLLIAACIVSSLYSDNPARGILPFMFAPPTYLATRKLRMIVLYYFPADVPQTDELPSKSGLDQTPDA